MSDTIQAVHRQAWESLVSSAAETAYAKYGVYASRTLAVRHPEVYLKGDRWFYEGASKLKGFAECYEEPTALAWRHMEYGGPFHEEDENYAGIPGDRPLAFDRIDLLSYRPTQPRRIFPGPYEKALDHRFGPMAVSLKTEGRVVTPLELAELAYFREVARGRDASTLFLVLATDGTGYLLNGEQLTEMESNSIVDCTTAPPCLVFNEQAVSYPLLGRDDDDPTLRSAVKRVGGTVSIELDDWESGIVFQLKKASALDGEPQQRMAAIASTRATGYKCHPYYQAWSGLVPKEDFDISISRRLCVVREFDRRANAVSPAVAHLYGIASGEGSLMERMRRLSHEYLIRTGVVREAEARGWKQAWRLESWGHVWPCGLMEHTIDDAFRSRTGHCVSQCHMMGAVLSLLKVPHVIVNFDRGGVKEGISHHFVLAQDGSFLFDDGIVNFRGVDKETEDYGPLLSFAVEGDWGRTVASRIYGNIEAERFAKLLKTVNQSLAGRFPLEFFTSLSTRETMPMDKFLQELSEQGVEEVPLP